MSKSDMTLGGVGFVYALNGRCWVLDFDQAKLRDQFVPEEAKHTATVNMAIILERILNNYDGINEQLAEMRNDNHETEQK